MPGKNHKKITPAERKAAIVKDLQAGKAGTVIAAEHGVSKQYVDIVRRGAGISPREKAGTAFMVRLANKDRRLVGRIVHHIGAIAAAEAIRHAIRETAGRLGKAPRAAEERFLLRQGE